MTVLARSFALALGVVLVACQTPAVPVPAEPSATPVRGGVIVEPILADIKTPQPILAADTSSQRVIDCVMALPPIILALSLMAAVGQSVNNVILALTILLTPTAARTLRSVALAIAASPYIEAALAAGGSHLRIVLRHIFPNVSPIILANLTLTVPIAILSETTLSFLGLGIQPPTPSWGNMLEDATIEMERAPWTAVFPGLVIFLAVVAINFIGDGLRDALDPRHTVTTKAA
jgi:peptide/nickel transport system permease protein